MFFLRIATILSSAQKDEEIKYLFGVRGVRTWMELNGTPAICLRRTRKAEKHHA